MKIPTRKRQKRGGAGYLDGQLLIAMPVMTDRRFARSVIYMCAHSEEGAMGLIINHPASHISFPDLLERLGITTLSGEEGISNELLGMSVHVGGPVETGRGFVLHTADYHSSDSTLKIDDGVSLTATIDILKAIATGKGPGRSMLALGYAGWSPGQLDGELLAGAWIVLPAEPEDIFSAEPSELWRAVLRRQGGRLAWLATAADELSLN